MKDKKIDPGTADLSDLRAQPHLMDAIYLSIAPESFNVAAARAEAWERGVNALRRTVPL